MRNKIIALALALLFAAPVFAETIGTIDYRQLLSNYSRAKNAMSEIEDRANEIQRYILDKEKEYKKIDSAVQRKTFEDQTQKALAQKQDALEKYRQKKEAEIDAAINAAIKKIALENNITTVVDTRVIFFGGTDITDKVLKHLNLTQSSAK